MAKKLSEQRARTVTLELLSFRGWDIRPVSKGGQLLEENEYKHYKSLETLFKGKSKTGAGDARPDFLLVDSAAGLRPILIIETKASTADRRSAIAEATHYGNACISAGHDVITVGVSGAEKEICSVDVQRKVKSKWEFLTLEDTPIDWIPSPVQTAKILASPNKVEVAAERPSDEVLGAQANRLNEILRECKIKDEFRPIYAATFMLALWKGDVSTDQSVVLTQINANAHQALQKAGKSALSNSLRVDDENDTLAARAWEIIDILKKLNIRSFLQEHDYLGQLYETFFRYTGGNTIGQYFTPRHIIALICEIVDVRPEDIIFDPACGTGGFLIGALNRMVSKKKLPYEEAVEIIKDNLFGIESEPATAALCITNMILRGDGKSGVIKDDCFVNTKYPKIEADCALMNPPFPHKKTDTPTTDFIDRALASLKKRGQLATIVPYSLLVKAGDWHRSILKNNTLLFVATLPPDLFNPYASFNTAIIVLKKGIPHENKDVFFCRISNDGFKIKKNNRVPQLGSQLDLILENYKKRNDEPELCVIKPVNESSQEWAPEAFIENAPHTDLEFLTGFEDAVRNQAAFYIRYGYRLFSLTKPQVCAGTSQAPDAFYNSTRISLKGTKYCPINISDYFDVTLGGKEEIEDLEEGTFPVVSTSEFMNGVTAWRHPPKLYEPPTITVATDGSTCSSFVQEYSYYAFYKVAILRPKAAHKISVDALYFIAYLLRREKWRYVYARKFGKARINQTVLLVPSQNGKPDFEKMAEFTRQTAAYPIISSFRATYKSIVKGPSK